MNMTQGEYQALLSVLEYAKEHPTDLNHMQLCAKQYWPFVRKFLIDKGVLIRNEFGEYTHANWRKAAYILKFLEENNHI